MNHTAREIARETGDNPSAQYFEFDPVTFANQRIAVMLADWMPPTGENDAWMLGGQARGPDGLYRANFVALHGEPFPGPDTLIEEIRSHPKAVSVYVHNNRGVGFVEVSTSPDFARTGAYKSFVGRLTDLSTKVCLDYPTVAVLQAFSRAGFSDAETIPGMEVVQIKKR